LPGLCSSSAVATDALRKELSDADGGKLTAAEATERLLGAQITLRNNRRLQTAMRASRLLGAQITLRNNRRLQTAMRASRLPAVKTLADFDFLVPTFAQARAGRELARARLRRAQ
jgi:hypothetical protein